MKVGVVRNPRSYGNRRAAAPAPAGVLRIEPMSTEALAPGLAHFAREGVDLIVVDGGDGTLREVLSALPDAYGAEQPALAVLASGKTNVLALDLGAGRGWTLEAVLARAADVEPDFKTRTPLEVSWADAAHPPLRGFIFGLGAFVRATRMSQSVNRMGAYHNLSVGFTLAGAVAGSLFGGARDTWRRGVPASVACDEAAAQAGERFVLMATTLKRLPLGLKPFGPPTAEMKVLDVDAPPYRLHRALPKVLAGRDDPWLAASGYRRRTAERMAVSVDTPVVVDGEVFPGGELVVRRGPAVRFLAP